jgi:hypothetical protein
MTCQLAFSSIVLFPHYLVTHLSCLVCCFALSWLFFSAFAMNSTSQCATSIVEDFSLTFPASEVLDLAALAWWKVGISFVDLLCCF